MVEDDEDIIDVDDSSLMNNQANYAWEEEYKRSWDVLQEDEHGSLAGVVNSLQQAAKRKRYIYVLLPVHVMESQQQLRRLIISDGGVQSLTNHTRFQLFYS